MANLKFTLDSPGDGTTEVGCADTAMLTTPEGKVVASSLGEGDTICLFPDGSMPLKILSVEEV